MKRLLVLTGLLTLFTSSVADAAIEIDIGNGTIAADGIGFVDVTMTVSDPTQLFLYSLHFNVAPLLPDQNPDSELLFSVYPLDYAGQDLPDDPYVFLNASGNLAGDVPGGATEGLEWKVGDFADNADYFVDLAPGTTYLLARLKFQHHTLTPGFDPTDNVFAVSLIRDFDTSFLDAASVPIDYNDPSPGEVTITGGLAPIPEPSTVTVWALLGLCGCGAGWWRRRRRAG